MLEQPWHTGGSDTLAHHVKSQIDVQGHSLIAAPVLELLLCFVTYARVRFRKLLPCRLMR